MSIEITESKSRQKILTTIRNASPTMQADIATIQLEAKAIIDECTNARPALLADDATDAMVKRIDNGLVIGTSCQQIESLNQLPSAVEDFLNQYNLAMQLQIQKISTLHDLNWQKITIDADIEEDNRVGLCFADYGIAETGSFVVHSGSDMPILLNFLPLYLIAVIPRSKILHYMDDYARIACEISAAGHTPRNTCIISGVSGTTDIEGVLVQGAHGPEVLYLIIVNDL
jgi:L-lactate dehydrogenase complex protein LldG